MITDKPSSPVNFARRLLDLLGCLLWAATLQWTYWRGYFDGFGVGYEYLPSTLVNYSGALFWTGFLLLGSLWHLACRQSPYWMVLFIGLLLLAYPVGYLRARLQDTFPSYQPANEGQQIVLYLGTEWIISKSRSDLRNPESGFSIIRTKLVGPVTQITLLPGE